MLARLHMLLLLLVVGTGPAMAQAETPAPTPVPDTDTLDPTPPGSLNPVPLPPAEVFTKEALVTLLLIAPDLMVTAWTVALSRSSIGVA